MKDIIKHINTKNISDIESLHRYHEGLHQDSNTLGDIKYFCKSQDYYDEVTMIHNYICSIVNPTIQYFPTSLKSWNTYKKAYDDFINSRSILLKSLNDMFLTFVDTWNHLDKKIPSSHYSRNNLNEYLFYKDEIEEGNICILSGIPLTGKTHLLTHYVKNFSNDLAIVFYANHFSSNSINESISNMLKYCSTYSCDKFLQDLNTYGKHKNECITIVIDGINESPEFNIKLFYTELEQIKEKLTNLPYIKILISIREEYLNSSARRYCILQIKEPSISAIQSLCESLKISQQLYHHSNNMSIGFYYVIANVLEKMRPTDKQSITGLTKVKIFEKRWNQIQTSCDKLYEYDVTPNQVKDKLVQYILDNQLKVPVTIFQKEEVDILMHFQQENLLTINSKYVEFRSQYYSDYYIIEYIERNWGEKSRKKWNWFLDFVIGFISKLIHVDIVMSYAVDTSTTGIKYIIKNGVSLLSYQFREILFTKKYNKIVHKLALTESQHIALLELLREKYNYELPVKILKESNNSMIWLKSIQHLSSEEIQNNTIIMKYLQKIFTKLSPAKILMAIQNFPWIAHDIFINRSLKQRDMLFSQILSDSRREQHLLQLVNKKCDKKYYNIFYSFTQSQKFNAVYQLLWLLTLPHRDLRDKSTKVLINILCKEIDLYVELWNELKDIDDPYLIERLYVIGYSILINSFEVNKTCKLAIELYQFSYPENGNAYPHIVIQEYGLQIYTWILSKSIWQKPNHLIKSKQDLSFIQPIILSSNELEKWIGYKCEKSITLECEGHYGDWGRYIYQSKIERLKNDISGIEWELSNVSIDNFNSFTNYINQKFPKFSSIFLNINIEKLEEQLKLKKNTWSGVGASNTIKGTTLLNKYVVNDSYRTLLSIPIPLSEEDFSILTQQKLLENHYPTSFLFLGKHYIVQRIILDYWTEIELGEKEFEFFDTYNGEVEYNGRQANIKERFTKKIQWISMYEYMGYLRNYFNYIPALVKPESYLYFYDFSKDIQEKLLEYLSIHSIDEKLFFNTLNISDLYFRIEKNITTNITNYHRMESQHVFSDIDSDTWEKIKKVSSQPQLQDLHLNLASTNNLNVTKNEQNYIKQKLFIDNKWILLYGIESVNDTYSITFGSRVMTYNSLETLADQSNFKNPYIQSEENESFLEPTKNINRDYRSKSFIYDYEGKSEYDFSGHFNDREILSTSLIMQYNLQKNTKGYVQDCNLVIKKQDSLWYIHKDFAQQVINDYIQQGEKIYWWCYFEKMTPRQSESIPSYEEWRAYLRLVNGQLKGKFRSFPINDDFKMTIHL